MSLTTRIRFTEPVDPREVWAKLRAMINPPADYQWSHIPIGGNEIAWLNPLIYAEPNQGADVWAYVMYGQDGGKLVEDDEDVGPPAFVEVSLIGHDHEGHARITAALAQWRPIWSRDDYSNGWWPTS